MAKKVMKKREFRKLLNKIVKELLSRNGIEIFGNLKIEIVNTNEPLAFLKNNKIYVSIETSKLPKYILKYILAHELAHLVVKRHTQKFWTLVKRIYPKYEKAKKTFETKYYFKL